MRTWCRRRVMRVSRHVTSWPRDMDTMEEFSALVEWLQTFNLQSEVRLTYNILKIYCIKIKATQPFSGVSPPCMLCPPVHSCIREFDGRVFLSSSPPWTHPWSLVYWVYCESAISKIMGALKECLQKIALNRKQCKIIAHSKMDIYSE